MEEVEDLLKKGIRDSEALEKAYNYVSEVGNGGNAKGLALGVVSLASRLTPKTSINLINFLKKHDIRDPDMLILFKKFVNNYGEGRLEELLDTTEDYFSKNPAIAKEILRYFATHKNLNINLDIFVNRNVKEYLLGGGDLIGLMRIVEISEDTLSSYLEIYNSLSNSELQEFQELVKNEFKYFKSQGKQELVETLLDVILKYKKDRNVISNILWTFRRIRTKPEIADLKKYENMVDFMSSKDFDKIVRFARKNNFYRVIHYALMISYLCKDKLKEYLNFVFESKDVTLIKIYSLDLIKKALA